MSIAFFLGWFFWQLFGPDRTIIVSRETTYLTAPLRADGLPDFERYILEKYREGVTPENNAALPYLRAMGPGDMKAEEFAAVAKELGLDKLPPLAQTLEEFEGKENEAQLGNWLRSLHVLPTHPDDAESLVWHILEVAEKRPWTSEQIPPLAEWVIRNQQPLDLLVQATSRPFFYAPPPRMLDTHPDSLLVIVNDAVHSTRDAARALAARGMWRLGENQPELAWKDILAIHRLARLIGIRNASLIDSLVAMAIDGMACTATNAILSDPQISADLANQIRIDLHELGPLTNIAKSFDEMERMNGIDLVLLLKRERHKGLSYLDRTERAFQLAEMFSLDWNTFLLDQNEQSDQIVAAMKLPTYRTRIAALKNIEKATETSQLIPSQVISVAVNRQFRSRWIAQILKAYFLPALAAASNSEHRANTQLTLTQTAGTLAAYRAEFGQYPIDLNALKKQAGIGPIVDAYDNPLVYRRTANGYLLYACGENAKDDGGSHFLWERFHGYETNPEIIDEVTTLLGDELPKLPEPTKQVGAKVDSTNNPFSDVIPKDADDISIRLPLPKLELPKRPEPGE